MLEEISTESIKNMLKKIPDNLSPVERLILANESTVQTLLSVLFKVPVEVEILDQIDTQSNPSVIIRWSKLVASYSPECKITVCLAQSVITSDNPGFMNGIREKMMGIGQLIAAKELVTRRRIRGFYTDENVFSRIYEIEDVSMTESGSHISCLITEVFPKEAFNKASVVI